MILCDFNVEAEHLVIKTELYHVFPNRKPNANNFVFIGNINLSNVS